jgi:hypothetical protein
MNRFDEIYHKRQWASGTGVLSGSGSSRRACAELCEWLESLAGECEKILDLGCGDLEWISEVAAIRECRIGYHGVDVVATLVAHHLRVFPWFSGEVASVECLTDARGADVVLLKDVLFHVSTEQACAILRSICSWPDWRYFAVTSHAAADNASRPAPTGPGMAPFNVESVGLPLVPIRRIPRPDGGAVVVFKRAP